MLALIPLVGAMRPCPSCGERPRRRELVVEIVTAGLFVAMSVQIHDPLVLLAYLLFSAFIVAVSAIDLEHYRIPDRIVFPMLAISVPAIIAISFAKDVPEAISRALLGSVTFFGVLLIFHLISPRGMGFGDVKLGLVLGLYTGWLALDTDRGALPRDHRPVLRRHHRRGRRPRGRTVTRTEGGVPVRPGAVCGRVLRGAVLEQHRQLTTGTHPRP